MVEFEKPMTCRQISKAMGGSVSEEQVRAACHRDKDHHPLPHTRSGEKRPVIRIRPSVFASWYAEEERYQIGA